MTYTIICTVKTRLTFHKLRGIKNTEVECISLNAFNDDIIVGYTYEPDSYL